MSSQLPQSVRRLLPGLPQPRDPPAVPAQHRRHWWCRKVDCVPPCQEIDWDEGK